MDALSALSSRDRDNLQLLEDLRRRAPYDSSAAAMNQALFDTVYGMPGNLSERAAIMDFLMNRQLAPGRGQELLELKLRQAAPYNRSGVPGITEVLCNLVPATCATPDDYARGGLVALRRQ